MTKKDTIGGFEDLFDKDNEVEVESSFFKFNTIGDRVAGILSTIEDVPPRGKYGAARNFTLRMPDASEKIVSIPITKKRTIKQTEKAELGDTIGFEFKSEWVNPADTSLSPSKNIEVFIRKNS